MSTELENRTGGNKYPNSNLSRSRSAQSLKLLGDSATQDDKMTILAQLFWLSVSLLESDYEHEFLLALRLLSRVLHRLPLDRPDARDKVEKLQQQLRWTSFPGVHALLLKGCTSPNTYEPVVTLLSQFTPLLDLPVVDPTQSLAFPMNVVSLLPYMLLNYEDANELCIRSAENIAQVRRFAFIYFSITLTNVLQLIIYLLRLLICFPISLLGERRKGEEIRESRYSYDVVQPAYFQQGKLPMD